MRMPIQIVCECGRRFKARDEDVGKRAKCPACGAILSIEDLATLQECNAENPAPPGFRAMTLELGSINARFGSLSLSLRISEDGDGEVHLFVTDRNSRRNGVLIGFGPDTYDRFLAMIDEMSSTIRQLQSSGQMNKMLTVRSTDGSLASAKKSNGEA